jgi:hypothetical protein
MRSKEIGMHAQDMTTVLDSIVNIIRGDLYNCSMSTSPGRSLGENRRTTCNKKIRSNIFIVGKFCKKFTCKIGDFKIVKHVYM